MGCTASRVQAQSSANDDAKRAPLTDLRPPKRTSVIASASGHISWRKGDLIGTGANGRVYLGLEEDTGAIIAVKEVMFTRNVSVHCLFTLAY